MATNIVSGPLTVGGVPIATSVYTVYTALLTQTSTNAPVATVLNNTTGSTLTWTRQTTGVYVLTATLPGGIFTANKVFFNITPSTDSRTIIISGQSNSTSTITIVSYDTFNQTEDDSLITKVSFELRIYL